LKGMTRGGEVKRVLIWFLAAAVVLFTPLPGGVNPAENAQEWCRLEDLSVSLLPCEGWFMTEGYFGFNGN